MNVQLDILDLALPFVDVEAELIQTQFLLKEVADVVLEDVAAGPLLNRFRPRKVPRHRGGVFAQQLGSMIVTIFADSACFPLVESS